MLSAKRVAGHAFHLYTTQRKAMCNALGGEPHWKVPVQRTLWNGRAGNNYVGHWPQYYTESQRTFDTSSVREAKGCAEKAGKEFGESPLRPITLSVLTIG